MSTPTVQSIDRAFEILEALGNKPEGMLVKELSAQLGLNKSTVSRILATLAEHGYVEKNKNNYCRFVQSVSQQFTVENGGTSFFGRTACTDRYDCAFRNYG